MTSGKSDVFLKCRKKVKKKVKGYRQFLFVTYLSRVKKLTKKFFKGSYCSETYTVVQWCYSFNGDPVQWQDWHSMFETVEHNI